MPRKPFRIGSAQCKFYGRSQQKWDYPEHLSNALSEILSIKPSRFQHSEIEMVFAHAFDCPSSRLFLGTQTGVEIEFVFSLDVKTDEDSNPR